MTTVLVTGAAGFIGGHLSKRLVKDGCQVIGVDNLNDYYDVGLKAYRLRKIDELDRKFEFKYGDIRAADFVDDVIKKYRPSIVINMAGQAGVRYSMANPALTFDNNVTGFFNVLEACRVNEVEHLIFASSSTASDAQSFYGVTKASNELMAESYSKLYGMAITGLRFFTVYGAAGRPDMAYFKFAEQMNVGEAIQLYNEGKSLRSFTYIDDAVECVARVIEHRATGYKVYDVGGLCSMSVFLMVEILQDALIGAGVLPQGYKAHAELLPAQKGEAAVAIADMRAFKREFGHTPQTLLDVGLEKFAGWYAQWRGGA